MIRYNNKLPKQVRLNGQDVKQMRLNGKTIYDQNHYVYDGLMGYFRGDASRNTYPDKSVWKNLGSGGNLTLQNFAYAVGSGWTGNSLYFDGVDDVTNVITLPNSVYTLEYVFERPSLKYVRCPVSNRWSNITNGAGLRGFTLSPQSFNDGTGAKFWLFHGTVETIIDDPLEAGVPHHVCATFNQADTKFRVYIDGVLKATINNAAFEPHNQLVIGRLSTNLSSATFEGAVFCVRVYDRYLTPEEVLHNYNIDKEAYGV